MVYQRGRSRPSQLFVDVVPAVSASCEYRLPRTCTNCEIGKEERPSPRANCCVSERQKDQHTLDHVLAPHISMPHVKVPSNSMHPTDPARTPQMQPYVAIKCNSRFASSTKNEKCHSEANRGDDGAKPCGSGTRGPVERLQQSVSISFDQSLKRHWCYGNISTTFSVFPRISGQNSWCALYSQHILLRTARDLELHTRTQDFAVSV